MGLLSLSLTFSFCKMWVIIFAMFVATRQPWSTLYTWRNFHMMIPPSWGESRTHSPSLPCSEGTGVCFGLCRRHPHVTLIWKWALCRHYAESTFWSGVVWGVRHGWSRNNNALVSSLSSISMSVSFLWPGVAALTCPCWSSAQVWLSIARVSTASELDLWLSQQVCELLL